MRVRPAIVFAAALLIGQVAGVAAEGRSAEEEELGDRWQRGDHAHVLAACDDALFDGASGYLSDLCGGVYMATANIDRAILCFARALALDPQDDYALRQMTVLYSRVDLDKAKSFLERAEQLTPNDAALADLRQHIDSDLETVRTYRAGGTPGRSDEFIFAGIAELTKHGLSSLAGRLDERRLDEVLSWKADLGIAKVPMWFLPSFQDRLAELLSGKQAELVGAQVVGGEALSNGPHTVRLRTLVRMRLSADDVDAIMAGRGRTLAGTARIAPTLNSGQRKALRERLTTLRVLVPEDLEVELTRRDGQWGLVDLRVTGGGSYFDLLAKAAENYERRRRDSPWRLLRDWRVLSLLGGALGLWAVLVFRRRRRRE